MSNQRPAPSEVRMAISFSRAAARASSMLATLRARNQQQYADRRKQRIQRRPELPHEAVHPAHDMHGELRRVVVGIDFRDAARDEIHLSCCPLEEIPRFNFAWKTM